MKTTIFTFALLGATVARAANPSLENFDQLYFKTNAPAPGIIQTRMNTSQFRTPVLPGDTWTITNVTGLTGASHWTNVAGVLQPIDGTSLLVTNLVATSNTVQVGTVTWLTKSTLLSLGTNVLGSGVNSMFVLLSPTNDASQVILSLNHGYQPGQKLRIVNYTNNPGYSGAFTLPAGSALNDLGGGFVRLPEDWVGTNGFVLDLEWQSPDWLYAGGWTQDGQPVFQTNYFHNVVIYSNLTAHVIRLNTTIIETNNISINGTNLVTINPTTYRVPYRASSNSFWDSPWQILPANTNALGFNDGVVSLINDPNTAFGGTVAFGYNSGSLVGNGSTSFGSTSGRGSGIFNVAVGRSTMSALGSAQYSTALGAAALGLDTTANETIAVGWNTLGSAQGSSYLTAMGNSAGEILTNSTRSVLIGQGAAYQATNMTHSVWIGEPNAEALGTWPRKIVNSISIGWAGSATNTSVAMTNRIQIGHDVHATNDNDIVIGNPTNQNIYLPQNVYAGGYLLGSGGGGITNTLSSLTPAAPQTITFSITNGITQWLVATGQVTIASTALSAAAGFTLNIDNPTATNINVILPSGWRYISGTTTNILASTKIGVLSAFSRAANDTNVVATWQSE